MATSPSDLGTINRRRLNNTEYMSGGGTEINDGKRAENGGLNEGLLPTNPQASVEQASVKQGNEVHREREDNTGSHNTHNTLPTMEKSCASQPPSSTETEKASWCFVGQYTEGGKTKDGTYPLVEAQEFEIGRLQYRIHNPGNPNHEKTVPWGRFVLNEECCAAFVTTKERMVEHVRRKLHKPAGKLL